MRPHQGRACLWPLSLCLGFAIATANAQIAFSSGSITFKFSPLTSTAAADGTSATGISAAGDNTAGATSTASALASQSSGVCNGYSDLCSKAYGNVAYVGAHNSFGVAANNVAANQHYDVTTQLTNGIRMLQGQGHKDPAGSSNIHLCHTTCSLFDGGTLVSYLTQVYNWMQANPNEIVTLLFVNSDGLPASQWASAYQASGLSKLSYSPSTDTPGLYNWPTLQQMINQGQRAVTFLTSGTDFTNYPYLINEFNSVFETPYDVTNTSFPCVVDRPAGSDGSNQLMLINHYLDSSIAGSGADAITIPNTGALSTTNGLSGTGSLGDQATRCQNTFGRIPNFLLLDYYDVSNPTGAPFEVAASLNNVTWQPTVIGNGTTTANAAAVTSASSTKSGTMATRPMPARSLWVGAVWLGIPIALTWLMA